MNGWLFVVKLMDAHTFDVITQWHAYDEPLTRINQTVYLPADDIAVNMDFPPLFTDTYFINAPFYTTFLGMTWYHKESCAIINFRTDDCSLGFVVNMMDMQLPTHGVSYYWGCIFFSLNTGKIEKAELYERVDTVTWVESIGMSRRGITRREILLERISHNEFKDY
jgi:hypothetical protein